MADSELLERADLPGAAASWLLHCPVCHSADVEQGLRSGGDHAAVTVQPDRDSYDSPIGTRGGYLSVTLSCADGHDFDLVIANHKGAEYLGVVSPSPHG
jgi:hypothetical protein